MKIDSDDRFTLKKTKEMFNMAIVVRVIFS